MSHTSAIKCCTSAAAAQSSQSSIAVAAALSGARYLQCPSHSSLCATTATEADSAQAAYLRSEEFLTHAKWHTQAFYEEPSQKLMLFLQ